MDSNGIGYESSAAVDFSPIDESPLDEREIEVYCWRMERLMHAGYNSVVADLLAAAREVDLHHAVELVGHGCPPQTAVRILL